MSQLASSIATATLHPSARLAKVIYDSNPFEAGWLVAILQNEQNAAVAIRWKTGRLRPGSPIRSNPAHDDWFILPEELAGAVRETAERLELEREAELVRGYQEMAADTESEQEALEWIESHVGECL